MSVLSFFNSVSFRGHRAVDPLAFDTSTVMQGQHKRIVLVVASANPEGDRLVRLVEQTGTAWSCERILPEEMAGGRQRLASAAAIIIATDTPPSALDALPADGTMIACGATQPSPNLASVSWLKRPTLGVLRTLLSEALLPEIPLPPPAAVPRIPSDAPSSSQGVWRRKTDMIIGRSAGIRRVLDTLDRIAPSPAAASVTGESGTGKELVARALHYSSPRAGARFIALNCAAIPEALFEAELFGYVRGAFTGATSNRQGAFESAHHGTLFLDEIGEMPLSLQPKLLRALERGEVMPLGSSTAKSVSVRIVTATNRHLEEEVRAGKFRQDLYYRLRVCHLHIPPLRERLEDIAPLVAHHLSIIATRERRAAMPRLHPAALEKLLAHRWPGNVRELVNVLEAAVLLAPADSIGAEHLQLGSGEVSALEDSPEGLLPYREAKSRFESDYYTRLLRAARGNVSLASKLAQKTRKEIYDALRKAGVAVEAYRDDVG